jgi:hypothetical protein
MNTETQDKVEIAALLQIFDLVISGHDTIKRKINVYDRRERLNSWGSVLILMLLGVVSHILSRTVPNPATDTPVLKIFFDVFPRDLLINLSSGFYSAAVIFILLERVFAKRQENQQKYRDLESRKLDYVEFFEEMALEMSGIVLHTQKIRSYAEFSTQKDMARSLEMARACLDELKLQDRTVNRILRVLKTFLISLENSHFDTQNSFSISSVQNIIEIAQPFMAWCENKRNQIQGDIEHCETYIKDNSPLQE